jgi:hypothetical protein
MGKMICCRCKNEKEEEEFTFKNKKKNIRNKTCKFCFKEIRKKWYEKYKKRIIAKNIANKQRNIKWFNEYRKNLKCVKCDENHPACLEFHHIDPKKKEYSVSMLIYGTYSIKTILNEINKCEVLCSNCHNKEHFKGNNAPVVQLD